MIPSIEGSTDSELLFHLALTFGLEDDAVDALERMAGFVEDFASVPFSRSIRYCSGVSSARHSASVL